MSKDTVILYGDDPAGYTGFGRIVDNLVSAVIEAGAKPEVVALKGVTGVKYDKAKVHRPDLSKDPLGWTMLEKLVAKKKAPLVVSVGDPWDIHGLVTVQETTPFQWLGCTPVDSTPYPRFILVSKEPQQYLDVAVIMEQMKDVITFSDFGTQAVSYMLKEAFKGGKGTKSLPNVSRVYLGVDSDKYTTMDKHEARKIFDGAVADDAILFSCIKVNSWRAGFDTLLEAWAQFMELARKKAPDIAHRSKLYLHTNLAGDGYPIPIIMKRHRIEDSLLLNPTLAPGNGASDEDMIRLYNATDVAVSATRAEGFGLNIVEALSCGVPCIVPDYGCPAEYGGEGVLRVPIAAKYNPEFATTDFAIVSAEKMAKAMFDLATHEKKRKKMGKKGRAVAESLSWQEFVAQWSFKIKSSISS